MLFDTERKKVVKSVKNGKNYEKAIDSERTEKIKTLQNSYLDTISFFGKYTYNRLLRNVKEFSEYELNIIDYIKETTAEKVTLIDDTTKKEIKQIIQEGIDNGYSIEVISDLIDNFYLENIIPNRSTVIARTETVGASNYGSMQGAIQVNKDYDLKTKKIWIATLDNRVRPSHADAGGHSPINLNEYFTVGDSQMKYPADPEGSADEVVGCRCAIGYVDG